MNKVDQSQKRRSYTSRLREEQAGQTRERILSAVAGLLRGGDLEELSFATVARDAGVSVPTVYRYFPSRDALFEGVQEWISRELKAPPFPRSVHELESTAPAMFAYYEGAQDLFRTAMVTSLFRDIGQEQRLERDRKVASLFAPVTGHLDERRANAIHALFRLMYGFEGYSFMRERFGVSSEEAGEAIAWVTRVVVAALEAGGKRNGTAKDAKGAKADGKRKKKTVTAKRK